MTKLDDIERLYTIVRQQHTHIDVVFANAGGGAFASLGAIDEAYFDELFATNVKGVVFTVQKALPLLCDGCTIILTGSLAGSAGNPAFSIYGATKAAVRSFARNWMLDLKDRRIRVNVVSTGVIDTAGLDALFGRAEQSGAVKSDMVANIPSARIGQPQDVAAAVLFLASDAASFVNGAELFVDDGMGQI